ncbi:MAG: RDD family protein [Thermoplasmata archaeon]|nr:RDD family protein [Thermoplasmata archaeon]
MVSALNIIGTDKSLQEHWGKRIVAIIIDAIIWNAIAFVLSWFVVIPTWGTFPFMWFWFQPALSGVLLFIYSFAMEASSGGATLGKRAMNLRVIPVSGEMSTGKAAIRNVSKIYGMFLLLDWLVGFVSEGDPKQKWLDRVGGTTVVLTTALNEAQQHTYQSQQAKYAPPPQEQYSTRHEQVYQYPPVQQQANAPQAPVSQQAQPGSNPQTEGIKCGKCGGRMAETGAGRLKCIRCGTIQ